MNCKLYFRSDIDRSNKNTTYDILAIRSSLDENTIKNLFFNHAFTRCDSTPRIFNIGKQVVFKKFLSDLSFMEDGLEFSSEGRTQTETEEIGSRLMVTIFGGKRNKTLSSCRHKMIIGKVGSAKSVVNAERLPPTQSATKYHSLRSYYQICVWKCTESALNPSSWGWSE